MDAPRRNLGTSIQITALDAIVNVNSLFTLAVFLGLAWNPTDLANTLIADPSCVPSRSTAENLVSFHVYSFSSFLFSSLLALALKQVIRLSDRPASPSSHHHNQNNIFAARFSTIKPYVNRTLLRVVLLVTAVGSVSGCVFLMLALVNLVQVKLGTLSCGSPYTYGAVVPLVIFVPAALIIYIGLVLYAFTR
ncbi:uncharacterized protein LOC131243860 [Magnolia sinica]|uniref:uncharacterized protein LOC131243860 n=1 Tax=Magnolia sinica TaxID=86752 RepID=UPI00265AE925|nr:uncharacterized protein LOC131243860 [Magnolia sinica]